MNTPTRAKAFQVAAREPRKLKEGQRVCPICDKGVMPNKFNKLARHKDDADGSWCPGRIIKYGYVYQGTGVDTLTESA
jgi:hypothetical protein